MYDAIAPLEGQRITVLAVFRRHGNPAGGNRVLFGPVFAEDGSPLTEHFWLTATRRFAHLDLLPGVVVEMRGRVLAYARVDGGIGYRLSDVRGVRQLSVPHRPPSDPLSGLGDRLASCGETGEQAANSLSHLRRLLHPTGRTPQGDAYATLLAARGQLWAMQKTLAEARGLYAQIRQVSSEGSTPDVATH